MSPIPVLLALGLLAVLGVLAVAANAFYVWLGCSVFTVPGVNYRRSLRVAVLLLFTAGAVVGLGLAVGRWQVDHAPALWGLMAAVAAAWWVVKKSLRVRAVKAVALTGWWLAANLASLLALLLVAKLALVPSYIIPTGAMAESLQGYHKEVACPACSYQFAVNGSSEAESPGVPVTHCTCPHCGRAVHFGRDVPAPLLLSGDRILVAPSWLDRPFRELRPFDVAVFRFPEEPEQNIRYVKRLIGLPGQTVGVFYGDLYVAEGDVAGNDPADSAGDEDLPVRRRMKRDQAKERLEKGDPAFQVLRKPPDKVLAMRHLVYNNDLPAADLVNTPRWAPEKGSPEGGGAGDYAEDRRRAREAGDWRPAAAGELHHPARPAGADVAWLRYRHLLRGRDRPELITDVIGYNSHLDDTQRSWVGDLLLECTAVVESAEQGGEFLLELCKGPDRFRARFDLATGLCTLLRLGSRGGPQVLTEQPTSVTGPGTYRLRFANVDDRLTLWVGDSLPFGDGQAYDGPRGPKGEMLRGPTPNDLGPAAVGAHGAAVTVRQLTLWRDTYYTYLPPAGGPAEVRGNTATWLVPEDVWGDSSKWEEHGLTHLPAMTFFVQPGHYFLLGDNSPQSADCRCWGPRRAPDARGGLVPEALLEGRAFFIYFPPSRIGPVR